MFAADQYELIDFGDGTKIERFGDRFVARETPSVELFDLANAIDSFEVDASFDDRDGDLAWHGDLEQPWQIAHNNIRFSLRQTPSGQVGLFPEQADNWDWIGQHAEKISQKRALNLFAYTGGTSMALAAAGASVTHVDSASSVVKWASENARLSSLESIRWIVDDAVKFVRREIKRGTTYDILVADPPSFGRGHKKGTWKIERDLDELLELASQLCPNPLMGIISCHTPSFDARDLAYSIREHFGFAGDVEQLTLALRTSDQRILDSGQCARFVVES